MITSSQCPLDPSQHVYSAKRQHEQRIFTKTRSSGKHLGHGITCHVAVLQSKRVEMGLKGIEMK